MLVERKGWMTEIDFTETLSLCQSLPGPNIVNLSVVVGSRYAGVSGALACLTGLLGAPVAIVIVLAILNDRFGAVGRAPDMLLALGAAAAGLVAATVAKIARPVLAAPLDGGAGDRDGLHRGRLAPAAAAVRVGAHRAAEPGSGVAERAMKVADTLVALLVQFALLSLLAFGGANAVVPEMHRQAVDVHHWITGSQFAALFAIAQAAPGPNVMISTLVGWKAAGLPGALVATLAMCAPSCVLTFWMVKLWDRSAEARWRRLATAALAPLTVGLVTATAYLLIRGADRNWRLAVVTLVVAVVAYRSKLNPLWLLGAAAVLGLTGMLT